MDVQADIGQVVKVLAGNQPNDLADLALGIMASQTGKSVSGQLSSLLSAPSHSPARRVPHR